MNNEPVLKKINFSLAESPNMAEQSGKIKIICHNCGQKLDVTDCEPFSIIVCPSCQTDLIVPRWFDSYLLEEIVGEGGMATVYRALDPALDREVAIKILRMTEDTDEGLQELFLDEARTASVINHQSVLAIYTCSIAEGSPYIVMEFMGGGSLEKILEERKSLDILQVCKWIYDVAAGLERAARYGIVHHDIKPANIMVDYDGNVKIGDFGIAQRRLDRSSASGGPGNAWGSPYYVSPEKAREGIESFSGDIYSLGAAFYHLLTGKPPFHENEDLEDLVYIRIKKDPVPPSEIRKDIPGELSLLVMNMMARDPKMRPGYQEIKSHLAAFIKQAQPEEENAGPDPFVPAEMLQESEIPVPEAAGPEFSPEAAGAKNTAEGTLKQWNKIWTVGIFVACILAAIGIYCIVFRLFRMIFSSLKG